MFLATTWTMYRNLIKFSRFSWFVFNFSRVFPKKYPLNLLVKFSKNPHQKTKASVGPLYCSDMDSYEILWGYPMARGLWVTPSLTNCWKQVKSLLQAPQWACWAPICHPNMVNHQTFHHEFTPKWPNINKWVITPLIKSLGQISLMISSLWYPT
jgi:hypothetical protein